MEIDFNKYANGLVPAIIQDQETGKVLMLGYMNEPALRKTRECGKVTFYSRSRQRLWTKGEESGNFLKLVDIRSDCDRDSLLVKVIPEGPTCHTGTDTCWGEKNVRVPDFLEGLEQVITERREDLDNTGSYVSSLFRKGINKIAQKVGEEAVEVVIEAKDDNKDLFLNECADLLFHFLVLLQAKSLSLSAVIGVLRKRQHKKSL